MADDGYDTLMDYLEKCRSVQLRGMRQALLERRCQERARQMGCGTLHDYAQVLRSCPHEMDNLLDALLIKETRFFRDPLTYTILHQRLLPEMLRHRAERREPFVRLWSVGCATGDEAYTLALLTWDVAEKYSKNFQIHVLATDRDREALEAARVGRYGRERLGDLPVRLVDRFFQYDNGMYRVVPELRHRVRYVAHDLLQDKSPVPPDAVFKDFDLVSCQNVFMYYDRQAQEVMAWRLYGALQIGGVLVLGMAESLPPSLGGAFERLDVKCALYRRVA